MKTLVASIVLAVSSLAGAASAQAPAAVSFIHAGRLLAEPGEAPRGPSTVVVRDGKVAEVRNGLVPPKRGPR